jgi:putative DNA primase/helicase
MELLICGQVSYLTGEECASHIYLLPTHCLRPADPSYEWLAFLRQVVPGEGMTEYLQRCVGYSITGDTREECFFYVLWPNPIRQGDLYQHRAQGLGYPSSPLVRGVSFNTFTVKREGDNQNFDLAPLKACRLVSASREQEERAHSMMPR